MLQIGDLHQLKLADQDRSDSFRGQIRVGRRVVYRCVLDRIEIHKKRIFCQNSGACGSSYVVQLLKENGIERAFHEKTPDLNKLGLEHYEQPAAASRLKMILRYTRHDAFFEANNRLFSMSRELAAAFPSASFIHLHRDGIEAVRSAMSKPNVEAYLATNVRFSGSLAGSHAEFPFARCCHYWANMNRRIATDMQRLGLDDDRICVSLRFENLITGDVAPLERVLGVRLSKQTCAAVNIGRVGGRGKFPHYRDWNSGQKQTFDRICGPVMELLDR